LFMGVFSSWFTPSIEKPVLKIIRDARGQVTAHQMRTNALPRVATPPAAEGGR